MYFACAICYNINAKIIYAHVHPIDNVVTVTTFFSSSNHVHPPIFLLYFHFNVEFLILRKFTHQEMDFSISLHTFTKF